MRLKHLELHGFKSFGKRVALDFAHNITAVVGPNGSGKSNVVEAFRFVLGEQSMKSMRGKSGTDLIFKGSKNLPKGSSAKVVLEFDNQDKIFRIMNDSGEYAPLNFESISIGREVFGDGLNTYTLSGSEVRLKDVNSLLSSVHIGSSGHHIISQGEADRVLSASPRDLREIVEDALGLKLYQYKIREAERKLERSKDNMKEVSIEKRENAPHLNFLRRQVEKFEKAKEMKEELLGLYKEYLSKEQIYIKEKFLNLSQEKDEVSKGLEVLAVQLSKLESTNPGESEKVGALRSLEERMSELYRLKESTERKLGRIEGMLEAESRREVREVSPSVSISRDEATYFIREMHEYIDETQAMDIIENVVPMLERMRDILNRFAKQFEEVQSAPAGVKDLTELQNIHQELSEELKKVVKEQESLSEEIRLAKEGIKEEMEALREGERARFALEVKMQEFKSKLSILSVKEDGLRREEEELKATIEEAKVLVGEAVLEYSNQTASTDLASQDELKRKIERLKIKLEDAGLGGESDTLREYKLAEERDQFLTRELADLEKSIESLRALIVELSTKINVEFEAGVKKINREFNELFTIMFGGGEARLSIMEIKKRNSVVLDENGEEIVVEEGTEDESEKEYGLDIAVSLPHKKVKELHALSGGERSLASIALLFAMSQVNPPPFLILDETDAALDEANSRKYGDMLERLSKHSQLIVVTHNRETMSRAGILYGVTIGSDGASKLLSVKFEEAQAIAK